MSEALCANPACRRDDHPREVHAPWTICRPCTSKLRRACLELPSRHHALERVLARQRPASSGRVSGSPIGSLPLREQVAAHREHIRSLLVSWAQLVAEERQVHPPADRNLPGLGNYLATHVLWLARHPAGGDAAAELTQARNRASALLDLPPDRARFEVGPCPEYGCPGRIWVRIAREDSGESVMYCTSCERDWGTASWLRTGVRILARQTHAA